MINLYYWQFLIAVSVVWFLVRLICNLKSKSFSFKSELSLFTVYICLLVLGRFTFFPFFRVDGEIQPLVLDFNNIFNFKINLIPFIHLKNYNINDEIILNLVGNYLMFLPIGIVWPSVFKRLNTPLKVILSGIGFSLLIEILQLPFYSRVTDIDDFVLNSAGYITGYVIYLIFRKR